LFHRLGMSLNGPVEVQLSIFVGLLIVCDLFVVIMQRHKSVLPDVYRTVTNIICSPRKQKLSANIINGNMRSHMNDLSCTAFMLPLQSDIYHH
jgi:hypothetical protein